MASESLKARHLSLNEFEPFAPEGAEARARADGASGLIAAADEKVPAAQAPSTAKDAPAPLQRLLRLDADKPRQGDDVCLDEDGNRAGGALPVACPSAPLGRFHLAQQIGVAARTVDALVVAGVDRWYALGAHGAGFCPTCEMALVDAIRRTYGEHVQPFRALEALRVPGLPLKQRPFAGLRHALRLTEPLAAAKAAILRARDEARRARNVELPIFVRTGPLSALGLMLCRHVDGLVFDLPLDPAGPLQALFPLLAARAALGERPALARVPAESTAAQVRLLASLAASCDVDVLLEAGASAEARKALADDRRYRTLLRERFRATLPLADVSVFVSPASEHWSLGAHFKASRAAVSALASANLQVDLQLERVPERSTQGDAGLLVVAGCTDLPEALAAPLRRFVEAGGDLLLVGPCTVIDGEGHALRPLFPESKAGIERVGEGRLWTIVANAQGELPEATQLEALVLRAARELMGRRRPLLSLSGPGRLLARAYLDPERKLDVHLTNLDAGQGAAQGSPSTPPPTTPPAPGPAPATQGVLLTIAGAAAGGGRSGYWFSPERTSSKDGDRLILNPSGFSVSCVLPAVDASALIAVPR